ncbi:MAG: adenosylcobinamide amidohydrolase [Candidatus Tectimicrobiota bacterium]|nr:MAG: adenosylcobinamide amidohydrolase [Candidatus Tectomicrobia bacterium]
MQLDFPGLSVTWLAEALLLHSQQPLQVLSSALVGGGFTRSRYILSRHVPRHYHHPDPAADLAAFARAVGVPTPFVGLMTAVALRRARAATLRADGLTAAAVVTAGLSNPSTPGVSPPAVGLPGTINVVLLLDADLAPAAMVGAVITATEAKTAVLLERGVLTPQGSPATGTSTDAVVVACTRRGRPLPYAGAATQLGWLIGRCVRTALHEALG